MFSKHRFFALATVLSGVTGCSLVDPHLAGFQCDDAGHCLVMPSTDGGPGTGGGAGGGTGGGTNTGGGTGTGGGAGGGTGTGGGGGTTTVDSGTVDAGPPPCSSANCTGCCDSENQCQTGNTNLTCGLLGAKCATCSSSTGCTAGDCAPLKANGTSCGANAECTSGACVAGACCSSACTGACETCGSAGSPGICVLRDEGTPAVTCAAYACDGLNPSCPTMCTSSRQCAPGRFCILGKCDMLKDKGETCAANGECQTGFCADSVCCDKACSNSCDRCNLAGKIGTCSVSPANDPGQPLCGGSIVCNGTLTDCPITCVSGCPTNTYCSGTYCSAKKTDGTACGAPGECTSGFCANGVCCNQACSGACQACSTTQGAVTDGKCAFLGPSRTCRAAASSCDVAEHCDGTAASCPSDGFTDGGVTCGTTTVGAWTACSYGSTCARGGSRTRPNTSYTCSAGSCGSSAGTETDTSACARNTSGNSCGSNVNGSWSTCSYASTCSATGSRTRQVTSYACSATGTCDSAVNTETDTASCTRTVEGSACGTASNGAWSACTYATACSDTGSRTRTVTVPVCQSGSCNSSMMTETDTTGCARSTAGSTCGTTDTGAFGSCSYGAACSTSGSRTRTITTYTCGSGTCNGNPTTDTDTAGCSRATDGNSCSATTYGSYTACTYADACATTGSRTRSVTTYACGSGTCSGSTSTDTDTAGCARSTNGSSCSATTYGGYGSCSYADGCINSGSRTRAVTTYTCNAGTCGGSGSIDTDTAGCARNTAGASCGATSYGGFGTCSYADVCTNSGSRSRSVTTYTCGSGTCGSTAGTDVDTAGCARDTSGAVCAATSYGAYTACSYATFCSSSGSRTRSVTSYACGSGACNGSTGTDTDIPGCARVTQNLECVAPVCGSWSVCNVDCDQSRTCTHSTCLSDVCTSGSYVETRGKPTYCNGCVPR